MFLVVRPPEKLLLPPSIVPKWRGLRGLVRALLRAAEGLLQAHPPLQVRHFPHVVLLHARPAGRRRVRVELPARALDLLLDEVRLQRPSETGTPERPAVGELREEAAVELAHLGKAAARAGYRTVNLLKTTRNAPESRKLRKKLLCIL